MNKILALIKDKHVKISFIVAILLSVLGYFTNNWALFTGETLSLYTFIEWGRNLLEEDDDYSGAFFVNTSMDKQLIDVYRDGNIVGQTAVTDRHKLLKFLKLLKQTDYEYVVIDISFAEELSRDSDSVGVKIDTELFDLIKSMDRCVVATSREMKLLGGLKSKAALATYKSTVNASNFVRYEYFDSIPSIPIKVYNDIRKGQGLDTIDYSNGVLYHEGGRLCQNSLFLEFSAKSFSKTKKAQTELGNFMIIEKNNYRDIGFDYLDNMEIFSEEEVLKNLQAEMKEYSKEGRPIVLIGNLTEDLHNTYAGLQPGVIILYKAIRALQEGRHIVNPFNVLFLFVAYFLICLFILKDKPLSLPIPREVRFKYPFVALMCQFISLSMILLVLEFIEITFFNVTTNFILTILLFNTLKLYVQFKKNRYNETGD